MVTGENLQTSLIVMDVMVLAENISNGKSSLIGLMTALLHFSLQFLLILLC